jgi:outer membrane protein assembly factor BamB
MRSKAFLVVIATLGLAGLATAEDWAQWRGPSENGVSLDRNLPERWSPDPRAPDNNLIWKAPYGGRSTPLVMNDRVYLINHAGEGINDQERVMCFDARDGKVLWEYRFNVWHTDIVSVRLGWTNLAGDPATGNIYAHGTQGLLLCFDRDGKILWSHSLTEEYGRISGYGGRVTSPAIAGDLLIIGMLNASWGDQARGGTRFVAMDKRTGHVVWWTETGNVPKDTYYSVPITARINGEDLIISGGGDGGVYAFQARTGKKVWGYVFGAGAVNCSPVVAGNRVYIGHGEENLDNNKQGRFLCLDAGQVSNGKPRVVWDRPGLKIKYSSPALHDGRLYVCDENAMMYCLDADTGKQIWKHKYGRNAKGSPVWADGKIYIAEVNAKFHILKPDDKKCEDLHTQYFPSPDGYSDVEINGSPAVANGRVYFMTRDELFCIGTKEGTAGPATEALHPMAPSHSPTWLQIVPADVALDPGSSANFSAYLFDSKGNELGATPVKWSVGPPGSPTPAPASPKGSATPPALRGTIDHKGKLTVSKEVPGQFGSVVANADGLTATARVRVVPNLPVKQDFKKVLEGRVPGGWVNAQGKFSVRKLGDTNVFVKLANNASPLVCRANAYITRPQATNYTIRADVRGARVNKDMPDAGVSGNRYTLMLDGNKQRLRIVSWEALPRIEKSIDWAWEPNTWYTLKLRVDVEGDKAQVHGKAWKRGDPEPDQWTVEVDDPCPNREGSAALYGYATGIVGEAKGAEIFYDNVSITPNSPSTETHTGR